MSRRASGFTLIELLMTVLLMAILASVAMPMVELTVQRHREENLRDALRQIREALNEYKRTADEGVIFKAAGTSGYPAKLDDLVDGVVDIKSPSGAKIYFLRRLPSDPFSDNRNIPPAKTWGIRSYASSAEDPKEGKDVFDIYSLSAEVGLNGIPYRQW